jgi:hypothetical protein
MAKKTPRAEAEEALREAMLQAKAAGHTTDAEGHWPRAAATYFDDSRFLLSGSSDPDRFVVEPLDWWDDYTWHRYNGYDPDPENY